MIWDILLQGGHVVLWGIAIYGFANLISRVNKLEDRLEEHLNPPPTEQAPKFRQRTAESNPGRQSKIVPARLRAKRTITPPPRPPRKRNSG